LISFMNLLYIQYIYESAQRCSARKFKTSVIQKNGLKKDVLEYAHIYAITRIPVLSLFALTI
jgi:hypothetical protein